MPPRTTQKSCKAWPLRQKSQIEPWLAHRPQILLVGVSVWHRQFDADTMYPTTPSAALLLLKAKDHRRRKGLNDENYLSPASRERCFLLTLPFIEPAYRYKIVPAKISDVVVLKKARYSRKKTEVWRGVTRVATPIPNSRAGGACVASW